MHVDVDLARIERDEQRYEGMAVARQVIGIGGAHHADQELVAHWAAVDEEILAERIGARERGQRGEALDRKARVAASHLDRVGAELAPENISEPGEASARARQRRGPSHWRALLAREREGDVGPAHRQPAHHLADRLAFAAVAFEEFEPRRRGVEQVAHFDARAFPERAGLDLRLAAAVDGDRPAVRLAAVPRGDGQPRNRADRGQRLAAEAQGADVEQIVVGELGGGVALDRQREIVARHAGAVIADADQAAAAAIGHDFDARRAGIERVLHEFLDYARGTLHHLARRDAVDDAFGELAYGHLSSLRRIGEWRKSSLHRRRPPRDAETLRGRAHSCFTMLRGCGAPSPAEEVIMRAIGLSSITLATVALTATDVRSANNNWCATYTRPANENCTFATFEQCQAQVWGLGGWCRPNPFPNTAFGTGGTWSNRPRQSRGGR